jgi:mRNA-degrading endonuclease RelE of RelBE toxin-antitoxin system
MSFEIRSIPKFDKQLKRLSKKYPSLKSDFSQFVKSIKLNPHQGSPLGSNCYKIRVSITSKGKGKSGGARIITHLMIDEKKVYLLSIYDKSERASILDSEIKELVESIHR